VLVAAFLGAASPARADGDPASDFLLSQSTFLSPFDGHVSKGEAAKLVQMLAAAKQKGLPLKVAVITSRYDLGAVPSLFRLPQTYARFLATEDFYYWKDELLVVMPNGYGIYKAGRIPKADQAVIARLAPPAGADGTSLVVAAQQAVQALAATHGITRTVPSGSSSSSSTTRDRVAIAGAVLLAGLVAIGARFLLRRRKAAP
jgi:hypothetical protein